MDDSQAPGYVGGMIWIVDTHPRANPLFHTCYDVSDPRLITRRTKFAFRCAADLDGVWRLEGGRVDGQSLKGRPACDHPTLAAAKAEAMRVLGDHRKAAATP